jgi:putative restriction endonuclease
MSSSSRPSRISATWRDLATLLGYSNFDPRGKFYPVAESKLAPFGGVQPFLQRLTGGRSQALTYDLRTALRRTAGEPTPEYAAAVQSELRSMLETLLAGPPGLTEGKGRIETTANVPPRSAAFRTSVAELYEYRCAICGTAPVSPAGLVGVESAHIYPRGLDGSDDVRNGLVLCKLHHWAFDCGWMSVSDDQRVVVRPSLPDSEDYDFIRAYRGAVLRPPLKPECAPHPVFLRAHRRLHGFD